MDVMPDAFLGWIATCFTAFRTELDAPTAKLYWRVLGDVPSPLLDGALTLALQQRVYPSVPRPAELRQHAETVRQRILAAYPWTSCGVCSTSGWLEAVIDGVTRMTRCSCIERHRSLWHQLGAAGPPLQRALSEGDRDA